MPLIEWIFVEFDIGSSTEIHQHTPLGRELKLDDSNGHFIQTATGMCLELILLIFMGVKNVLNKMSREE
jgi:hypothetical protein